MPEFTPGLTLSREFHRHAVAPLLAEHFPDLPHAAARIGPGSEVLGFDTPRSADHEWGPRLQLFLRPRDTPHADAIHHLLATGLPKTFLGWPTHFTADGPIGTMAHTDGPVHHRVEVTDLRTWCADHLGITAPPTLRDWLHTPTQALAAFTGGAVFRDDTGDLTAARTNLTWYPDDVWRHVLACQWRRVAQEEAFIGRTGEVGDELGSAVVTARLARDLMRLFLLAHRVYPPYSKWLGTAFARLPDAPVAALTAALAATDWRTRERHLVDASAAAGRVTNRLALADTVDPTPRHFHDRPFLVLGADRFVDALRAATTDPAVRALPLTGAVDQHTDNTDALLRTGPATAPTHPR